MHVEGAVCMHVCDRRLPHKKRCEHRPTLTLSYISLAHLAYSRFDQMINNITKNLKHKHHTAAFENAELMSAAEFMHKN